MGVQFYPQSPLAVKVSRSFQTPALASPYLMGIALQISITPLASSVKLVTLPPFSQDQFVEFHGVAHALRRDFYLRHLSQTTEEP